MRNPYPVQPARYLYAQPAYADVIGAYTPYYYTGAVVAVPFAPPIVRGLRQQIRSQLLDLNREIAGWLGMDPRYTLSTNLAIMVAARMAIPFRAAKQAFHGGVAGLAAAIIGFLGAPLVASVGLGAIFYAWLESFDSSGRRQ